MTLHSTKSAMKVYGGCFNGVDRLIVAAKSKAAALRAFQAIGRHISMHSFNQFACETWNKEELETAMAEPGVVFSKKASSFSSQDTYRRLSP